MQRKRSWLFVPANRPDRIAKAFASAADMVVLDLEDACPAAEKPEARRTVADAARGHARGCVVRINATTSSYALADLEAAIGPGVAAIMLPKAATLAGLYSVDWVMGQLELSKGLTPGATELVPLIESGLGVLDLAELARSGIERVRRLTFGAGDLAADLGTRWTHEESELSVVRTMIVVASRAAGLEPPIDTVWPGIADHGGLALSAKRAADLGFDGKLLIHPSQIDPVNAAFSPPPESIARARRLLAAAAEAEAAGNGAFQLDGRLVDNVGIVAARRLLHNAEQKP